MRSRGGLAPGRAGRPGRRRGHRPGQGATRRARPHARGERAHSGDRPADRADGGAPGEAAAHDLRVRQPGGAVAPPDRRGALPGRLRAGSAPPADDGGDRGAPGGQRAAGGPGAVDRAPAVRRPARGHGVRSGQPGLLRHPARLPRAWSAGVPRAGPGPGRRRLVRRDRTGTAPPYAPA